jgi:hypothetical protein
VIARILVTTVAGIEVFFFTVRQRERQSLATVFIEGTEARKVFGV